MRYLLKDDRQDVSCNRDIAYSDKSTAAPDGRFAACLGDEGWDALPGAIRARFTHKISAGQSCVYQGRILKTEMTLPGRILAQILRLIGAPLPFDTANNGAAAIVSVTDNPRGNGQFWMRQYGRRKGFPQVLRSTKCFAGPTGLEEYIGAGIGMTLKLSVERGVLWFESARYYIGGQKRRVYLPRALTPGRLRVGHEDVGGGAFIFSLDLTHRLFGRMIYQTIKFYDPEAAR